MAATLLTDKVYQQMCYGHSSSEDIHFLILHPSAGCTLHLATKPRALSASGASVVQLHGLYLHKASSLQDFKINHTVISNPETDDFTTTRTVSHSSLYTLVTIKYCHNLYSHYYQGIMIIKGVEGILVLVQGLLLQPFMWVVTF